MTYNAFVSTHPRTSRRQKEDAPSTAGTAKVSSVTARSKSELQSLGEQRGFEKRPLTMAEIRAMSSQELLWHEQFNAENYNRALELPDKLAANAEADKDWGAKKFWDRYWNTQNQANPEERLRLTAELEKFTTRFPQFISGRSENQVVLEWLRARNMELNYANLVQSFEANALEGRVWINPAAIGCGSESEISGQDLLRHRNFHKLLQSQQRPSNLDRLSADEFLALSPDLKDQRTPPLIVARQARADATAAHFSQTESTKARSGSTNVIDYPQQSHGVPPQPDKISFRKKIQSMTAEELRRECEIDPGFKKALDELK